MRLLEATLEAKERGYAEGTNEQKEFFRLANEKQTLVQQQSMSKQESQLHALQNEQNKL